VLAWEVWEAGSGSPELGGRVEGWSCCWGIGAASPGLLCTGSPKRPPPRPRGMSRSETGRRRAPKRCWISRAAGQDLSLLSPSLCTSPRYRPPRARGWHRPTSPAAEPSPAREHGSHGEAEGLPTSGFSHSFPVTSSPAPTSAVHRRCSLGSQPRGLCLGGNSIQMELFFHIFWGEGRKVWEKAAGTREAEGRRGFPRGLVRIAPFLLGAPRNRGLSGDTEARSTPPRAASWLRVKP